MPSLESRHDGDEAGGVGEELFRDPTSGRGPATRPADLSSPESRCDGDEASGGGEKLHRWCRGRIWQKIRPKAADAMGEGAGKRRRLARRARRQHQHARRGVRRAAAGSMEKGGMQGRGGGSPPARSPGSSASSSPPPAGSLGFIHLFCTVSYTNQFSLKRSTELVKPMAIYGVLPMAT